MFKSVGGDWLLLGEQYDPREVDLHFKEIDLAEHGRHVPYEEKMGQVRELVERELRKAHAEGVPWLMFLHGHSTSLGWQDTTSRSIVRRLMRSKAATPMIVRSKCIQHESVFLVRLRRQVSA
jgi:hypothetical protein